MMLSRSIISSDICSGSSSKPSSSSSSSGSNRSSYISTYVLEVRFPHTNDLEIEGNTSPRNEGNF
jgi:hypothetical protein